MNLGTNEEVERAHLFLMRHRYEDALSACREAIRNDPENGDAYALMGDTYWAVGQLDEALRAYKEAVQYSTNPAYQERLRQLKNETKPRSHELLFWPRRLIRLLQLAPLSLMIGQALRLDAIVPHRPDPYSNVDQSGHVYSPPQFFLGLIGVYLLIQIMPKWVFGIIARFTSRYNFRRLFSDEDEMPDGVFKFIAALLAIIFICYKIPSAYSQYRTGMITAFVLFEIFNLLAWLQDENTP